MKQEIKPGYDRVTDVLDYFTLPELLAWKVKVGQKTSGLISRQALKCGTEVDFSIKGLKAKLSTPEAKTAFEAFKRWQADYGATELRFPERLYDEQLRVTGEPDCLWGDTLIDFKCAKSIKLSYWVQLAQYADMLPVQPKKLAILRLDKSLGIYEFKTHEQAGVDPAECLGVFRGLLAAYRFYRPKGSEGEQDDN